MMKHLRIIIIALSLSLSIAGATQAAFLSENAATALDNNTYAVQQGAGFEDLSLGEAVGTIIKAFLGVLGMIFIILMLVAGFNWMTAAGEEEKIKKATATIRAAIIGLLIIVAAYAITYFVFANLPGSDSSTTFSTSGE